MNGAGRLLSVRDGTGTTSYRTACWERWSRRAYHQAAYELCGARDGDFLVIIELPGADGCNYLPRWKIIRYD
jgi:hypothetical protein